MFNRSLYHYDLPESLIASTALDRRDHSRLLVLGDAAATTFSAGASGNPVGAVAGTTSADTRAVPQFDHRHIYDLPELLDPNTLIVVNNTRVFAARLRGERPSTMGKIEFFLLKRLENCVWEGLMKSSARIDAGFEFVIHSPRAGEPHVSAIVLDRRETNAGTIFTARFEKDPVDHELGETPLPPYIAAARTGTKSRLRPQNFSGGSELAQYNTTYAKELGSVAAPTAGRHFTPELIAKLRGRGLEWVEITLHVGMGTFKPVQVDDIREHTMHPELATITPEAAAQINRARAEGRKILAVGTTTVRTLEGFFTEDEAEGAPRGATGAGTTTAGLPGAAGGATGAGTVAHGTRDVNLFIYPGSGHPWRVVDQLITNFHLPESTLLMMICDFVGDREVVMRAYREAIEHHYRFYSYGDAMLIRSRGVKP